MTPFFSRARSTFTVSKASSVAYSTLGTTIVTIVIIPLLDVLFSVLLGNDLGAHDMARIAYAATLVGMGVGVCNGLVSKVAADRNLGVFQEVHQFRQYDGAYWLGSALMPMLLVLPTGVTSTIAITFVADKQDRLDAPTVIILMGAVLVLGALLGVSMSGAGVAMSDPYQGANLMGAIVPIVAGVIVPAHLFPTWLNAVSHLVPLSGVLRFLNQTAANGNADFTILIPDFLIALVWAAGGLLLVGIAVRRLRSGAIYSSI